MPIKCCDDTVGNQNVVVDTAQADEEEMIADFKLRFAETESENAGYGEIKHFAPLRQE